MTCALVQRDHVFYFQNSITIVAVCVFGHRSRTQTVRHAHCLIAITHQAHTFAVRSRGQIDDLDRLFTAVHIAKLTW